jgi:glucose-6-phosphate dehydrogenase assembly protein OpcA
VNENTSPRPADVAPRTPVPPPRTPVRGTTFAGTLVAIVSDETSRQAVETLSQLSLSAVRTVLISLGESPDAAPREQAGAILIDGLLPRYLNNAIAYARLSSLPTAAWWRAGDPSILLDVAALVDRLVIDVEDPSSCWPYVPEVARLTSVSELRWARLTRWRDLVAQFFDLPEIAAAPGAWERLETVAADPYHARLLAGWLRSRLPGGDRLQVTQRPGRAPLDSLTLSGPNGSVEVRLLPNRSCLQTAVRLNGRTETRIVPLGEQDLPALLREELRVRSRDRAFEDAVREAERI